MSVQRSSEYLDRDGTKLFRRKWALDSPKSPKAIFHILHGIAEHSGRGGYDALGTLLASNEYVVFCQDQRAHGKTAEAGGGTFGHTDGGFSQVADDAAWLLEQEIKEFPGLPICLFGHSNGSMLAAQVANRVQLTGLALCGLPKSSGFSNKVGGSVLMPFMRWTQGASRISEIPAALTFKKWDKLIAGTVENRWLTSDDEQRTLYSEDPLCGFPLSWEMWQDSYNLLEVFRSSKKWKSCAKDTQIWLLVGDEDGCSGFHGETLHSVAGIIEKAGLRRPTVTIYGEARHELLNEVPSIREKVCHDILLWADSVTKRISRL